MKLRTTKNLLRLVSLLMLTVITSIADTKTTKKVDTLALVV